MTGVFKYIVTIDRQVLIFSEDIFHNKVWDKDDVQSAGFCRIDKNEDGTFTSKCYGDSISLKKQSNPPFDERCINYYLNRMS